MILEILVFFALLVLTTTVAALMPPIVRSRFWVTLPACALALAVAAAAFLGLERDGPAMTDLALGAGALLIIVRVLQPRWSFLGAQLFVAVTVASLAYIVYAALQTFAGGLPAPAVIASVVLLLLEISALLLAISFTFEICDVLSRRPALRQVPPLTRRPLVALQVPSYNEPVEVVRPTLEALAAVNYPNLMVQVVDNNTADPAVWRPLEQSCAQLGPRFSFIHLESWPGFKAGALNEATSRLPAHVELLGIVDADYRVHPLWLHDTVGHFDDPSVAFVQTSQHYRDWSDSAYLRGLFYSFRYFFDVTMPARNHRNSIIFCGTMGLIRRSALDGIGGWNEECITEDAEASLRMLGAGYRGIYDPVAYGEGLMPLDFDGLKKQRFRWALGGMQILRFHWRELVPFAAHRMRLTLAQRVHYLLGSLQWFADVLTALFTTLLLATALAIALHHRLPLRQLTGAVLVIPLAFAVTGVLRALWAMRVACGASLRDAVGALRVWFALSWVVTMACIRGLFRRRPEFLRTPKRKDGSSLLAALRSSAGESGLMFAAVAGAAAMLVRAPQLATIILGLLLLFEAFVYSNAPWASLAAEGIIVTPERRAYARSPQNTGDRPAWRRRSIVIPAGISSVAACAVVLAAVIASPSDRAPFSNSPQDLPRIGLVAPNFGVGPTPRPTPSTGVSPTPSPTTAPSATPGPTPTPTPSAAPTPTVTPAPTPSPSPSPT